MSQRFLLAILIALASLWPMASRSWATEHELEDRVDEVEAAEVEAEREEQEQARQVDTGTDENPEEQRRADRPTAEDIEEWTFDYQLYASVRVHAINAFDQQSLKSGSSLGDGASRVGVTAEYHFRDGRYAFARLESGFDVLDTFTTKAQNDNGGLFTPRLYTVGFESESVYARYGKSWSVYYKVAGAADRFSIFGGNAAGVYNAGTDGGATGTGRAEDALQTRLYLDIERWTTIKPFNMNVQFQQHQAIPQLDGEYYGNAWSFSAWQETDNGLGVGLAWHRAEIDDADAQKFRQAGIDGDAKALALAFKTYGNRWLASLVLARLENIETTNENRYFNGEGAELFAQWQFRDRWWLVGGANWLRADEESVAAGEYEIKYAVVGIRYTLDSFNRMLYGEWRLDDGTLADGSQQENEFTIGVRWDFGY